MNRKKLIIVMVGLPARGKSTIAARLKESMKKEEVHTRVFNNGEIRRRLNLEDTSSPEFYNPDNSEGKAIRDRIAGTNIRRAKSWLEKRGDVAILDATNVSRARRETIVSMLSGFPLLFIECVNNDEEILEASILQKVKLPEFFHLEADIAVSDFKKRIHYYKTLYSALNEERNIVQLDSLNNMILKEELSDEIPYYDRIRDFLVMDTVKNLYLIRHGETFFNLENRIGGDSSLTERGGEQASRLGEYFSRKRVPVIFTSEKKRTIETAGPIREQQNGCALYSLKEFDEIDSGECECLSYEEIRKKRPEVFLARKQDKYNYIYPGGEGYVSMKQRIDRGIKKALYLSRNSNNIMIIGHRAVNRMILSHFLYRRQEDVPYIYIPQRKFFHIVATHDKKQIQLKKY
ncbi:bifunctional nucleoside/nucleotide kinase/histidine phosphatase family protein [Thermodesulfobacteriota bacterium]